MSELRIKDKEACRWDVVPLGEVMLRLDPGEGRVHTTRSFQVWEGGGEYNAARGLKRCFGMDAAVVTALADSWAFWARLRDCDRESRDRSRGASRLIPSGRGRARPPAPRSPFPANAALQTSPPA